jgi:hypothetical protein
VIRPDPASVVDAPSGTGSGSPPETTNDHGGSRIGRLHSSTRSTHWRRVVSSDLFLGLVLAVLAWPSSPKNLVVGSGLTGSWQSALEMAAHNGMAFGTRIVFTYGPLGFLVGQQLNYASTALASFLFSLTLSTAIFAILLWSLRRALPLWWAIPLSYGVGAVSLHADGGAPEDVYAPVLIICVAVLSRGDEEPAPRGVWVGLGVMLSFFSLVKVSLGVGVIAVLIITVVSLPRGRWQAVASLAIGGLSTFCLAWFGTGNGLSNVVPFARSSAAIISGYGPAQSLDFPYGFFFPNRTFTYWWAALVVVVIGVFAFAHGYRLSVRARIGIGLVTLVVVWMLFKEGFVRHDNDHDLIFFATAPLLLAAFSLGRRFWAPQLIAILTLCVVTGFDAGGMPALVTRPDVAVRNFASEAATLASSSRSAAVIDRARRSLQDAYAIPNRMVAMMQGQTVDVSPWEQTVAWAYPAIHFDPLPVIQDYSAYTPSLDHLDAAYLGSPTAPRFILRQPWSVDVRNPSFEPPDTQLAIECSYRQVAVDPLWQLLERGADRCGPLRHLGTVTTESDRWVAVPTAPAGDAVVARFQLSQGWFLQLQAIAFKPPSVFMEINDGQEWRFVAATAPDLHVLRPASTLGYSLSFIPVSVGRLRFVNGWAGDLSVSFYEIPLAGRTG